MRQRFTAAVGATVLAVGLVIGVCRAGLGRRGPVSPEGTWEMPGPFKGATGGGRVLVATPRRRWRHRDQIAFNRTGPLQEISESDETGSCAAEP